MTIQELGPFAFRWQHATTGQVGRIVRTRAEAIIDWTQRCIYRMMND
jgi:hypothetical protein